MSRKIRKAKKATGLLLDWQVTRWQMNPRGGWFVQPVIIVRNRDPFFADHPQAYIDELERLHDDPQVTRGAFWQCIGQFKDALEQTWQDKKASPNGAADG